MRPWDMSGGAPYAVGSSSPSACTMTRRSSVSSASAVAVPASKRNANAACERMRNEILMGGFEVLSAHRRTNQYVPGRLFDLVSADLGLLRTAMRNGNKKSVSLRHKKSRAAPSADSSRIHTKRNVAVELRHCPGHSWQRVCGLISHLLSPK